MQQKRYRVSATVRRISGGLALALSVGFGGTANAGHSLQAGAFATAAQAETAKAGLQAAGCREVQVVNRGGAYPYKVCVGYFSTYAEAYAAKCLHQVPELKDPFIVPLERAIAAPGLSGLPISEAVDTSGLENSADAATAQTYWAAGGFAPTATGETLPDDLPGLQRRLALEPNGARANRVRLVLARKLKERKDGQLQAASLTALVERSTSLPEVTMARFIAGHVALKAEDKATAFARFRQVASDRTVPGQVRRESARRAAGVLHSMKYYPHAWALMDRIAVASPNWKERNEARKQQAGLAYELALNGKGTFDEVRALCKAVSQDPTCPREIRATAELMHLETWGEELRWAEMLTEAISFRATYSDVRREYHLAGLLHGTALYGLNQMDASRAVFRDVLDTCLDGSERFAGVEPRAKAIIWLAWISKKQGRDADVQYYVGLMQKEFPGEAGADELISELAKI